MIKILIGFLLFISIPVIAEQEDQASVTNNNEQTETAETKSTNTAVIKTPDSFDPTETLSQDIPIAFPVDI